MSTMSSFNFTQLSWCASCFIAGIVIGYKLKNPLKMLNRISFSEPSKLVLVVRDDLKMGKGKIAAQCSHATLGVYSVATETCPEIVKNWQRSGQLKVVLRASNLEEMMNIQTTARNVGVTTYFVRDAGRTQVAPGTKTVLAVGPHANSVIDKITGHLKLM